MKIAIDVGGVLIEKSNIATNEDTTFDKKNINWVEGSIDAAKTLAKNGYTLYILSFCGKKREIETIEALTKVGFEEWIPRENWIFVRNRRLKADEMTKHGIDILIDDTNEVVHTCRHVGHCVLHFRGGGTDGVATWKDVLIKISQQIGKK